MSRRAIVVCGFLAVLLAAPAAAEAGPWDTAKSALTKVAAKVYPKAKKRGSYLGIVAKGQHLAFKRVVATRDRCRAWLELESRGWICAKDVKPSDADPIATTVPKDVKTGTTFSGLDLVASPPPSWPFAWALEPQPFHRGEKKVRAPRPTPVLAAADQDAAVVRSLEPRSVVAVLETSGDFTRIGDGEWVATSELRIANRVARPDGLADDARWIDVDLDQQVLVTYQGDDPVYATLVSSGRRNGTPTGIYRLRSKIAKRTMDDGGDAKGKWSHRDTPFVMHFRKRYALHGAYWHDRFGNQRSVGCVNLAPEDARRVYQWATPAIPDGWSEIEAAPGEGSVVRIHSHRDRDPAWMDYDGEPLHHR